VICFLCQSYHRPHLNDDLGKWQSALLPLGYSGSHRVAKGVYEREKPFVVPGDEIVGMPRNRGWVVFQKRLGGEWGVASSAGILPRIGADRSAAGGNVPHTSSLDDSGLNLTGCRWIRHPRGRVDAKSPCGLAASLLLYVSVAWRQFGETAQHSRKRLDFCLGAPATPPRQT
jgi:hypothetical protein